MQILTVGTVAFDAIESPLGKTDKILGGAATYIALAAAVLEAPVEIVSVVGEDFPAEYLDLLRSKNIGIEGIDIKKGEKTFFWSGKYLADLNQRETLVTELNVLEQFNPQLTAQQAEAEILVLGNLHPGVQLSVLNQMAKRPKLVILDTMNFWMDCALSDLLNVIAKTDVLCINDEEARQLSGELNLSLAAKKIQAMGPKFLIIKKGEHGATLFCEGQKFVLPALLLERVPDPTGAGDSFAGGLAAYMATADGISFEHMKTAILVGSAMASFTVEKFGVEQLAQTTKADLLQRMADFKALTAVNYSI
jgi:sugar/nucleoside kinase (ribokinase family)